MLAVSARLVMLMTRKAVEVLVRAWIWMTLRALGPTTAVLTRRDLEVLPVVIKGRWLPRRGGVARLALVTERRDNMIRARRDGKICLMALIAIDIHKLVVPGSVTGCTRRRTMRASQREFRRAMVK